jgi:N-formylglutamate amidohydrolase
MFLDSLPAHANATSARVAGGLGTIPRIVADQEEIYADAMPFAEAERRIDLYYRPFHTALQALMVETMLTWSYAVLIDLHSMPSSAALPAPGRHEGKADIVLGDRYGAACDNALMDALEEALTAHGFSVLRNRPYAGGYITAAWGRPAEGLNAIQIEVNRGTYADERLFKPLARFPAVSRRLIAALAQFFERALPMPYRLAAE